MICERCAAIAADPRVPLPDIGWGAFDHAVWQTPAQRVRARRRDVPYWRPENAAARERDRARMRQWEQARHRRLGWPLDPPQARPEPRLYST